MRTARPTIPRPKYQDAVQWIAYEDDPAELNADTVAAQLTVNLIADLYGLKPQTVAEDVIRERKSNAEYQQRAKNSYAAQP